jgi:hypothetical protein
MALVSILSSLNLTIMKQRTLFVIHSLFLLSAAWLAPPAMAGPAPRDAATSLSGRKIPPHPCPRKISLPPGFTISPRTYPGSDDGALKGCCEKLMSAKRSIYYLNDWSYKMMFQVRAIYTREETMFFCLSLANHSHIDYSVDSIRFYIADDSRRPGRTAVRGAGLTPVCVYGNTRMIRGKTREYCVFALPRFTLPAKKILVIDVSEKNGGRHLQLLANNYTLVKARLI